MHFRKTYSTKKKSIKINNFVFKKIITEFFSQNESISMEIQLFEPLLTDSAESKIQSVAVENSYALHKKLYSFRFTFRFILSPYSCIRSF